MPAGSVFISYRREDAAGEAGRLSEHLARRFGPNRVFIDIDTIAPGTDYVAELDRALTATTVVLVVIGRQWLAVTNAQGTRRLDDPDDFVRREIQTALERSARVVPVLVQGAAMPSEADLPKALAPFATRQAMAIQHEEFGADTQRLADALAPLLEPAGPQGEWYRRRAVLGGALVALALVVGVAGWQWQRAASATAARAAAAARAAEQADAARRARQQVVDDLVRIATAQHERGEFVEAMTTLDRAVAHADADTAQAAALQQDVAMQWIREARVESSAGQTFADAITRPVAVLDRAAPFATGARQGDLVAHLGWATFLRWRDGERTLRPNDVYRKALTADQANPFANAMLGHWILWSGSGASSFERARQLFRVAADTGRAADVVRGLQLAALRNDRSAESRLETVRVVDEMRRRAQPLQACDTSDAWSIYYFALGDRGELTSAALVAVLPPTEHLFTLQWAFDAFTQGDESRRRQYRYYVARLQAAAGQAAEARAALEGLRAELGRTGGTLREAVDAELERVTAAPRRPSSPARR
jgi:tetratricopeptide (TPR) repeat protein